MTNQDDLEIREQEVRLAQGLAKLKAIPEFQELILDGYIKETLMRTSQYLISQDPATRQMTIEEIMAVDYFRDYLARIESAMEIDDE